LNSATRAPRAACETYERLGFIWREYDAKFEKPALNYGFDSETGAVDGPGMLGDIEDAFEQLKVEVRYQYHLTEYALRFLQACRGPQKEGARVESPEPQPQDVQGFSRM
jgi:hypothetical protein